MGLTAVPVAFPAPVVPIMATQTREGPLTWHSTWTR